MEPLQTLRSWVAESRKIVFFGGAGVSTESGIPDFRSVDGLYHQKYEYPPEQILSHTFFERMPEEFFRFYREKMLPLEAKPNLVHKTLARWEKEGRLAAVVTQNIDGLHQMAGSENVLELHGSIRRNYCVRCGKPYTAEWMRSTRGVPKCDCGGTIKPDVVLYEEALDDDCVMRAVKAIGEADLLLVCGTSLTVYPAAGLLRYYQGNRLVLINRDATPQDAAADLLLHESLGKVFAALGEE